MSQVGESKAVSNLNNCSLPGGLSCKIPPGNGGGGVLSGTDNDFAGVGPGPMLENCVLSGTDNDFADVGTGPMSENYKR